MPQCADAEGYSGTMPGGAAAGDDGGAATPGGGAAGCGVQRRLKRDRVAKRISASTIKSSTGKPYRRCRRDAFHRRQRALQSKAAQSILVTSFSSLARNRQNLKVEKMGPHKEDALNTLWQRNTRFVQASDS